jgi:FkbM family methyltransferase
MRRPLKEHCLNSLKQENVPVSWVIDVGVLKGTPELVKGFPDRKHILIEPVVEWNDTIRANYGSKKVDYELHNIAISNTNGMMKLATFTVMEGQAITHSSLVSGPSSQPTRDVQVRTLDSFLPEIGTPRNFLLKIDVDGVEQEILEGAQTIAESCSVIIVESNVQNMALRMNTVCEMGFQIFDLVDPCYYDNRLRQMDLVFLNERVIKEYDLDMYTRKFDYSKWVNYG